MNRRLQETSGLRAAIIVVVAVAAWFLTYWLLPLPWVLDLVVGLLVSLAIDFFLYFCLPYGEQRRNLHAATADLVALHADAMAAHEAVTDLAPVSELMDKYRTLGHPWDEFRDTLHEQTSGELDENAAHVITRVRQTVPAEAYFNSRPLIEGPLNTDYFRHLPGILTGLGIVGTFSGLILGLAGFGVAADPEQVNASVQTLIAAVREAFIVSACAIAAAMLITWVEKTLVSRLHDDVQNLQVALDQMFDAGVDEEYLSTIAEKSEQSATELSQLRHGLAEDLRDAIGKLGDQMERAAEANAARTGDVVEQLGGRIEQAVLAGSERTGEIVTSRLEAPLASMTAVLERSHEDQRQDVHDTLVAALEQFVTQMDGAVGDQMNAAAGHVEAAADLIGTALTDAPRALEAAATGYGQAMEQAGSEARELLMTTSAEARAAMVATTTGVRSTLEGVATDASRMIEATASGTRETLERVATAAAPMVEHSERISVASASLADSLGQGATRLDGALERLHTLGEELDTSVAAARAMSESLGTASVNARTGAEAVGESAARVREATGALTTGVTSLRDAVALQRTENDGRQALAESVAHSASELKAAQIAIDEFLAGVANALSNSHRTFSDQVQRTLTEVHGRFGDELTLATKTVAGAVGDLRDAVEDDLSTTVDDLVTELKRLVPATAR